MIGIGTGVPLHLRELFQTKRVYGDTYFPFDHGEREIDDVSYTIGMCAVAEGYANPDTSKHISLPCNEGITQDDVQDIVAAIQKIAVHYAARKTAG